MLVLDAKPGWADLGKWADGGYVAPEEDREIRGVLILSVAYFTLRRVRRDGLPDQHVLPWGLRPGQRHISAVSVIAHPKRPTKDASSSPLPLSPSYQNPPPDPQSRNLTRISPPAPVGSFSAPCGIPIADQIRGNRRFAFSHNPPPGSPRSPHSAKMKGLLMRRNGGPA